MHLQTHDNIDDFNKIYSRALPQKIVLRILMMMTLLGDSNIDLLIFNSCNSVCNFLDQLSSSYSISQFFFPSHITRSTKTLIDNIFSNIPQSFEPEILANLREIYSDHLPQILFVPGFYRFKNLPKSNVFICDWKKGDRQLAARELLLFGPRK